MRIASECIEVIPQNEYYLEGYFNELREQPARGMHDIPWVVGILLEENNTKILMISLDVCVVSKEKVDAIKKQIEDSSDISSDYIIINAIHSHSCPNGLDDSDIANHQNLEYYEYVKEKCVQLSKKLILNLQPAHASIGKCIIEGYYGNRNEPEKPVDLTAYRILFHNDKEELVAQIMNLNCHSTIVGPNNMLLTTDLLGNVRQKLYDNDKVMPYVINGASAEISNRHFRQGNDFEELERVVKGVSEKLLNIKEYRPLSFAGLRLREFYYPIRYDNTLNYPSLQRKKKELELQLQTKMSSDEYKLKTSELLMTNIKLGYKEICRDVHAKIIETDDLLVITFPGELSNQFYVQLKKAFPDKTVFIICYADDYLGYFMNKEMYGKCYECSATYIPKGEIERLIDTLEEQI